MRTYNASAACTSTMPYVSVTQPSKRFLSYSLDLQNQDQGGQQQQYFNDPNSYYGQPDSLSSDYQQEQQQEEPDGGGRSEESFQPQFDGNEPLMMKPIPEEPNSPQPSSTEGDPVEANSDLAAVQAGSSAPPSSNSSIPSSPRKQQTVFPPPPVENYYSQMTVRSPPQQPNKVSEVDKKIQEKKKASGTKNKEEASSKNKPGVLGRLLGFIKAPNQMHLPDDKDQGIVWDEKQKKWVDKDGNSEEAATALPAPPSDLELSRHNSVSNSMSSAAQTPEQPGIPPPPPPAAGNKFAGGLAKKRVGGRMGRIDVFKNSQSAPALKDMANNMPPPLPPMMMMPPGPIPNMLTPGDPPPLPAASDEANNNDPPSEQPRQDDQVPPQMTFYNPSAFNSAANLYAT